MTFHRLATILILGLVSVDATMLAQNRPPAGQAARPLVLDDSSVLAIMARQRGRGSSGPEISGILRQRKQSHSKARLDSLADSVTNRIISNTSIQGEELQLARSLLADLTAAGQTSLTKAGGRSSELGPSEGRAYPGVLDRLITIHKKSPVDDIRTMALQFMLLLPEKEKALSYLREVAVAKGDHTSFWAVGELLGAVQVKTPSSESIVRQLWEKREVSDRRAFDALEMFCQSLGWKRPPQ